MIWLIIIAVVLLIGYIVIQPYTLRYDTICSFTGGLGSGKTFLSVETAIHLWKRNLKRTKLYNFFRRKKNKLPLPLLYTSIPVRIGKKRGKPIYAQILTHEMLTLQERVVPGSVVMLDEVDVFASQWSLANGNIIEIPNKKDLEAKRSGTLDFDTGLFDESIRLWRHMNSSKACEARLVCNSQATSNITTIIRRRMNVVFVLANKHFIKLPFGWSLFFCDCRNITITDEITNFNDGNTEDNTRKLFRLVHGRKYDTHCYQERAKTIPITEGLKWTAMKTYRLLKCPVERMKSKAFNG